MRDKVFKNFPHKIAQGDTIAYRGTIIPNSVEYKPDIAIKNSDDIVHLILESERKTDRKAFIGAMIHAAMYANQLNIVITLVFVLKENGNQTTVAQIASNIEPYFRWLDSIEVRNISEVLLISDIEYDASANSNEILLSNQFRARCRRIFIPPATTALN